MRKCRRILDIQIFSKIFIERIANFFVIDNAGRLPLWKDSPLTPRAALARRKGMLELIALMALIDLLLALARGGDRHDDEE